MGLDANAPRVLELIDRFSPSIGGAELMVKSLSRDLVRRGVRLEVLTRNYTGQLPRSETIEGIPVTRRGRSRIRQVSKLRFIVSAMLYLIRRRDSYDMVHVHCCQAETDLLPAYLASLVTGRPYVVHMHSALHALWMFRPRKDHPLLRTTRRNVLPRRFWKAALRCSKLVLTVDPETEEILAGLGIGNLQPLPNGVPVRSRPVDATERRDARRRLGLPEEAGIVVFAGVLRTPKNVITLLRAWELVCALPLDQPVRLIILGAGDNPSNSNEDELRRFVADHQLETVMFTGFVSNVEEYLAAADCFAFPSLLEGMAVALLEAMSVGTPVVVSDIEPNRRLVPSEEYGLIFEPTDHEGLARKLGVLLADPRLRSALAYRAHSRIKEGFSIERTYERIEAVYREVTGTRDARSSGQ